MYVRSPFGLLGLLIRRHVSQDGSITPSILAHLPFALIRSVYSTPTSPLLLLLLLSRSISPPVMSTPSSAIRVGSSSLFLLLWDPLGATPVRSFSASSLVKLINVASPQENVPGAIGPRRLAVGVRLAGEAETLRDLTGEVGMRAMGREGVPGCGGGWTRRGVSG
jgi:hypothetical protein